MLQGCQTRSVLVLVGIYGRVEGNVVLVVEANTLPIFFAKHLVGPSFCCLKLNKSFKCGRVFYIREIDVTKATSAKRIYGQTGPMLKAANSFARKKLISSSISSGVLYV